ALVDKASLLLAQGKFDQAMPVIDEALSLTADDKECGQLHARALACRARFAIHAGDLAAAERDLDEAFELLQPMADIEIAAGIHHDLAKYWSTCGTLLEARHDWNSAV